MTTKHTPGPWTVGNNEHAKEIFALDGISVAMLRDPYRIQTESEANANLIAAAPELLAALRDVIGWIPGGASEMWHTDAPSKAVERARSAIAKAIGN